MSNHFGYGKVITNGLKVYLDVADTNCINKSEGVLSSGDRLYNLVSGEISYFYNSQDTYISQSLVSYNGFKTLKHDTTGTTRTTWNSDANITRVDNYTFSSWFRYVNSGQLAENIYGGGFNARTAFYLSPSGTGTTHGALLYSDEGSTNSYSVLGNYSAYDDTWHMFTYTCYGGDGNQTTDLYIDGEYKQTGNSNGLYDTPDGAASMQWGSWTNTYGNVNGYMNCFMYYERVLSADEIALLYNFKRTRFGR